MLRASRTPCLDVVERGERSATTLNPNLGKRQQRCFQYVVVLLRGDNDLVVLSSISFFPPFSMPGRTEPPAPTLALFHCSRCRYRRPAQPARKRIQPVPG